MKPILILLLVLAPAVVRADAKADAKLHIQNATTLHGEGKFSEALEQLTLAYQLDPKPELLYAMGQVHVQLGDCPRAITFYERYLATKPPAGASAATREAIETCKAMPPPEVKPEPPPPAPAPVVAPPAPVQPAVQGTPWYKDVVGDALVGSGIIAGVVSIVFYRQMSSKLDDADAATTYEAHQAARDDAAGKRNLSLAFGIGGVALVGAGVVRYMLRDTGERARGVALAPSHDGGFVTVMGTF